eukprot:SAG31_NODE_3652_length_4023_cov_12.151886_6_plen_113_part_00
MKSTIIADKVKKEGGTRPTLGTLDSIVQFVQIIHVVEFSASITYCIFAQRGGKYISRDDRKVYERHEKTDVGPEHDDRVRTCSLHVANSTKPLITTTDSDLMQTLHRTKAGK